MLTWRCVDAKRLHLTRTTATRAAKRTIEPHDLSAVIVNNLHLKRTRRSAVERESIVLLHSVEHYLAEAVLHQIPVVGLVAGENLQHFHLLLHKQLVDLGEVFQTWRTAAGRGLGGHGHVANRSCGLHLLVSAGDLHYRGRCHLEAGLHLHLSLHCHWLRIVGDLRLRRSWLSQHYRRLHLLRFCHCACDAKPAFASAFGFLSPTILSYYEPSSLQ